MEVFFESDAGELNGGSPTEGSLPELVQRSIMKCDIEIRALLCGQILVIGGTSQVPGFIDRLSTELSRLMPTVIMFDMVIFSKRLKSFLHRQVMRKDLRHGLAALFWRRFRLSTSFG